MEPIDTIKCEDGFNIDVFPEEYAESPRTWDNVGTMVCFHRNYTLGDEQPRCSGDEWLRELAIELDPSAGDRIEYWENGNGYAIMAKKHPEKTWEYVDAQVQEIIDGVIEDKIAVMLPLYLYDHSGLAMSTSDTNFRMCDSVGWDWGQVGWIYVTKEKVLKEWSKKRMSKKLHEWARNYLKSEVKTYDYYLRGSVYGFMIRTPEGEHEGGCWGFYGSDWKENGLLDHAMPEAEQMAEDRRRRYIEEAIENRQEDMERFIEEIEMRWGGPIDIQAFNPNKFR